MGRSEEEIRKIKEFSSFQRNPVTRDPRTEEQVEARELTRHLERWLDSLPQEDRVLFVRRYWYGEPAGKHVKRLWRLRQKLKAYLEQEGVPL